MRSQRMILSQRTRGLYDPDALVLFSLMTVAPDATRKGVISNLFVALKDFGVYSSFDVIYVQAAHDAQAAGLNWKNPGAFAMVPTGSPTFTTDRGYAGDGASSYQVSTFVPGLLAHAPNLRQNTASVFAWSRTTALSSGYIIGAIGSGFNISLAPRIAGDLAAGRLTSVNTAVTTANADGIGFYALTRPNSTTVQFYKNGAQLGVDKSQTSSTLGTGALNIGRVGTTGGYSASECAFGAIGRHFTATEMANIYTAVSTYMTAVGA